MSLRSSFALLSLLLVASSSASAVSDEVDPDRVLIRFDRLDEGARGLVRAAGGTVLRELPELSTVAVQLPAAAHEGLRHHPRVALLEPDVRRYLFAENIPWGIARVRAPEVWDAGRDDTLDAGAPAGRGALVCVIDSGLSTSHPDLAGAATSGYPADWASDGCGHGTHVTGTIAARLNGSGVPGVAPKATIFAVKVFGADCGWTYASTLVDAAYRCRDAGARVISMSLGGGSKSRTEEAAFKSLDAAGILSVAAAGNSGGKSMSYPASYPSVVSVGAIDQNDQRASFSQSNSQVDLAAPGVGVRSSVPWSPYYESWNGTSMATPHVAGGAALLLSARPSLSSADVRRILLETAVDLGASGWDSGTGWGRLDVKAAIDLLATLPAVVTVDIASPAVAAVEEGEDVLFAATARSASGVDVSASLVWTSNRDGVIGSGATFSTATLSANTHVITASATDASGATGFATVPLTVRSAVVSDGVAPVVSSVASQPLNRRGAFEITWQTDEPADSRVRFSCCGTFTDGARVTSHRMSFTGSRGTTYEFYVRSADAAGQLSDEEGPFTITLP